MVTRSVQQRNACAVVSCGRRTLSPRCALQKSCSDVLYPFEWLAGLYPPLAAITDLDCQNS